MAEIKPYGKGKWLVRVFIRRTAEGRMLRHSKVIRGLKTDAQKYARDVETKRGLSTLERPVSAARGPCDGLTDLVQAGLENPVLEGQLLSLYSSLQSLRPLLTGECSNRLLESDGIVAAFLAMALRLAAVSLLERVLALLRPPARPSATA